MTIRLILLYTAIIFLSLVSFSQSKQAKKAYRQQIANGLIKLDKSYFHYKEVTQAQKKSGTIHLSNNSNEDIKLLFKNVPNYITIECTPEIIKPHEDAEIHVEYDASKNLDKAGLIKWGKDYRRIPIYIKGKEKLRNARTDFITIRTFILEDFSHLSKKQRKNAPVIQFDTIVYNFGKIEQGKIIVHDFVFKNKGKDDLMIRYAKGC